MTATARGQPRWRPISALGLIGSVIDEGLAGAEQQYPLLVEAKHGPHVLDDHTVGRVIAVFGETHDDLWVFEEQLARWSKTPLSARQRAEVDRLILAQRQMRDVVEAILSLAEELQRTTIEAVLAKSDLDLGLEALFGGRVVAPRPAPPPPSARAREAARTQRLALPDGVSLEKGFQLSGTPYYAITHAVVGAVGRIVVSAGDDGRTRLDAEVAGAPSNPAFDRRRELVGLVFKEVERVISFGL